MSTKRISRSVIERGRPDSNKFDRRYSHKKRRSQDRQYLAAVRSDLDYYDEVVDPETERVSPELTDKLGALYRFLHSRVGRPWSEVFSEVRRKFDERSIAGYHVIRGHITEEVKGSGYGTVEEFRPFYIDENGILRIRKGSFVDPHRVTNIKRDPYTGPSLKKVLQWAKSYVIEEGDNLWWTRVNGHIWEFCWAWRDLDSGRDRGFQCKLGIPEAEHKIESRRFESRFLKNHHTNVYRAYHFAPVLVKWRALNKQEKEFWRSIDDRLKPYVRAGELTMPSWMNWIYHY